MKRKYAKREPSKIVECDICGQSVRERGLISHIRLKHKLKLSIVETLIKDVVKPKQTPGISKEIVSDEIVFKHERTVVESYKYVPSTINLSCCRCSKGIEVSKYKFIPKMDRVACDKCIEQYYHNQDVANTYVGTHYFMLFETWNSKMERLSEEKFKHLWNNSSK